MESFGKFLAQKGVLSKEQLYEATEYLVVVGGRFGTNLIDLGMLGIEEVDGLLAEFRGLSLPPAAWIRQPDPEALKRVPSRVVGRHTLLPLAIENRTLHLAMADPDDPSAIDEVRFATGLGVKTYLLSESHLAFLRERHLGIPRERRFVHLVPEWAKPRGGAKPRGSGKGNASARAVVEIADEREAFDLGGEAELTDAATYEPIPFDAPPSELGGEAERIGAGTSEPTRHDAFPSEWVGEADRPPVFSSDPGPLLPEEVALRESELGSAPDRDAIADCALRLARTHATAVALFAVHRGVIRGCGALGVGFPRTDGLLIPMSSDSVLSQAVREGQRFRGAFPSGGVDEQLFSALGREGISDAVILPVRIRGRVLNLLYADNGSHPLGESSVAALVALSDAVSRAYARLILLRKREHC